MSPEGRRLDDYLAVAIRELKDTPVVVELKRPIELAGLKGRLLRAQEIERSIAVEGKVLDGVLDQIEERRDQIAAHRGQLERYNDELGTVIRGMIADGSNQPTETSQGNGGDSQGGAAEKPET